MGKSSKYGSPCDESDRTDQRNEHTFELWHNKKPNFNKLIVFRAKAYVHISKVQRKKLDSKAKIGVFVRYREDVKGFRIWYPETNRVEYAKDVDERKLDVNKATQSSNIEQKIEFSQQAEETLENSEEEKEQEELPEDAQNREREIGILDLKSEEENIEDISNEHHENG